jgi:hypothetical protein
MHYITGTYIASKWCDLYGHDRFAISKQGLSSRRTIKSSASDDQVIALHTAGEYIQDLIPLGFLIAVYIYPLN